MEHDEALEGDLVLGQVSHPSHDRVAILLRGPRVPRPMSQNRGADPEARGSKRKRPVWPILFFVAVFAIAIPSILSFRVLSPDNALWFSSTLAQVSVTLVAVILLILTYLATSNRLSRAPSLTNMLAYSGMLFFGTVIVALLSIAVIPSLVGVLSPVDVSLRILAPAVVFAGGVVFLYYAVEDILGTIQT